MCCLSLSDDYTCLSFTTKKLFALKITTDQNVDIPIIFTLPWHLLQMSFFQGTFLLQVFLVFYAGGWPPCLKWQPPALSQSPMN